MTDPSTTGPGTGTGTEPGPPTGTDGPPAAADPAVSVPFRGGREGYASYRIPAVVVTGAGTLLAFCEGRVGSASDHGHICL
ncbi:exo-alpha-sialidase, partial [Streptomyces anthocyanicus]